jgi:hypothetical protein
MSHSELIEPDLRCYGLTKGSYSLYVTLYVHEYQTGNVLATLHLPAYRFLAKTDQFY